MTSDKDRAEMIGACIEAATLVKRHGSPALWRVMRVVLIMLAGGAATIDVDPTDAIDPPSEQTVKASKATKA